MIYLRLAEKTKHDQHSPMYWRVCKTIALHIKRKGYPVRIIHRHTGEKCDDVNSITMSFLNGRNPVHMYLKMQGRGSLHEYFRANTFSKCVTAIIAALEEISYDENSVLCRPTIKSGPVEIGTDFPILTNKILPTTKGTES